MTEYSEQIKKLLAEIGVLSMQINRKFSHDRYYKLMCNRLYDSSSNESLLNELAWME